jgi:hypothetical protein
MPTSNCKETVRHVPIACNSNHGQNEIQTTILESNQFFWDDEVIVSARRVLVRLSSAWPSLPTWRLVLQTVQRR